MSRRRFQIDLGTLFWLITVLCVCLVAFPSLCEKLDQYLGPGCQSPGGRDERLVLSAASSEDDLPGEQAELILVAP